MTYAKSSEEVFSETKFVPAFETILLGSLYSEKTILHVLLGYCTEPFHQLHDWEFAVVIYNTKIMLVINGKDVSSSRFPWPP